MNKPFLIYRFRGFIFEFQNDHVVIKDITFGKIYKMTFNGQEFMPFLLTLEQQGVYSLREEE